MPPLRLFYLAWIVPRAGSGANSAMRQHFLVRRDFDCFVASTDPFKHPGFPSLRLRRHPALVRLSNTRFCRWMRQVEMLVEPAWMLRQVESAARQFAPDAVFTIPDNTVSWTARLLARRLRLPLITNFQDWWPRGQFGMALERPFPPVRWWLERRFRRQYAESALAFCTSEGMRRHLGPHPNAQVLYPSPAQPDAGFAPDFQPPSADRPLKLIYAGTILNAYGRMILDLARTLRGRADIEFRVYGPPPDWAAEDRDWMTREGIYGGLLTHAELKGKLRESDACLVAMTFESALRLMMETSFTTKFLEYTQHGKPILVWGPEYCQPVQIARRERAGLPVTERSPEAVLAALPMLRDPHAWLELARGAWAAANGIFSPDLIHAQFRASVEATLRPRSE